MKNNKMKFLYFISIIFILLSCKNLQNSSQNDKISIIETNSNSNDISKIVIEFLKGKSHNHPLMAIWSEDTFGNYIETFYISQSIAKGTFKHVKYQDKKCEEGEVRRPATLPYWAFKRNVIEIDGLYIPTQQRPIPDVITGATPEGNFVLNTKRTNIYSYPKIFNILFEINQAWDWNNYWHNAKYFEDKDYKTSCQPSLIYSATINIDNKNDYIEMKIIGHGHFSGKSVELFNDLSSFTSALNITKSIKI